MPALAAPALAAPALALACTAGPVAKPGTVTVPDNTTPAVAAAASPTPSPTPSPPRS